MKLTLVYSDAIHTPTVSLAVVSFEPTADGTYLCTGALDISAAKLPALVMQMAYAGVEGADRRASRRLPYTIRILSKELSSFRAVTNNINLTGVELTCDNPVAAGHYMNLQFDLESVGFPVLKMQGVCIWSLEEVDESRRARYRVGVCFTNQHPDTHAAWSKFYRSILASEGASVMLKTMDGGSITEKKPNDNGGTPSVAAAPPPPPPPPAASASGKWTVPPTGNPFASGEMPAVPSADTGYGFPPPQQPAGPTLNFVTPPAAVPSPTQLGGGFNTQHAPPPPLLPNKLQLPPSGPPPAGQRPQTPGGALRLPDPPAAPASGFGFPSSPGGGYGGLPASSSGGFSFTPPPEQPPQPGGGFGYPSASTSGGYPTPPVQPSQPSGGFSFPSPPPAGGGGFPFPPAQQQGAGFPTPPSPGGFQLPPPQAPPSGGMNFPTASSSGGFPSPSPHPGGFSFPSSNQPPSGGFQLPPSPSQGGFQLPGTASPQPTSPPPSGGFGFSPPPPAQGGFNFPSNQPAPPANFGFPPAAPPPPPSLENVQPLKIQGANLAYRGRMHESCQPGARKQVQLTFNVGGRATAVPINVGLTKVEPAPDGTCVCWCTVLEDGQKISVLNQLLGG